VSTSDMPASDVATARLDRWLEQLAGAEPSRVDLRVVRRRARRVRLTRLARHVGAAGVAVVAAVVVSQSMIGGAAQPGDWSSDEAGSEAPAVDAGVDPSVDAGVDPSVDPSGAGSTPAARATPIGSTLARSGAPGAPAPRSDGPDGSWGLVPLGAGAGTAAAWARDHAFDRVVALETVVLDALGAEATRTAGQRVTSW
jgi:hypothetical protein